VRQLVQLVGGLPCIIKLLRGTQGVGVMLGNSLAEVETILQTFWSLGQDVCLQEFIAEAKGSDLRALVVGDQVVGAMRRTARKGEFRANLHRGGAGRPVKLDAHTRNLAVRAAKVIGLEVCGVDLLESADGPKVMELNSSPGFQGLEAATKKDIAGDIVRHALKLAAQRRG
jgi:ribosomal protein S6--L-glutamate ligase